MSEVRAKIQTARFQDDVDVWAGLVEDLMRIDIVEGMKAAMSGLTRASPNSRIKQRSVELVVDHAPALAAVDIRSAVEAAISAAIGSKPESDWRRRAIAFITDQAEPLSKLDFQYAAQCIDFAVKWAIYDAELTRESAETRDRLIHREEDLQQAAAVASRKE